MTIEFPSGHRLRRLPSSGQTSVLSAIARYLAAWEKYDAVLGREPLDADGRAVPGTPEYYAWRKESEEACEHSCEALMQALSIEPRTAAEAIALIDFYAEYAETLGENDSDESAILFETLRMFLSRMAAA